ncbi:MAG: aminomethyl-transferring glycine dehydrogenase [Burkholderiaceae bacterium]|nr:aminomethyl-transferring glycine dehydrogenase [Burkholderiaceae bacterium]
MSPAEQDPNGVAALFGADEFLSRHLGSNAADEARMLAVMGVGTREELIAQTVPASIRRVGELDLPDPIPEAAALAQLREIASHNQVWRSYIGAGYYGTITPEPIKRNVLENPGWYTAYTPYQAEVSQGRLEALLTFQQMVIDLTGLPIANASLLDEATAAAEAMAVCRRASKQASNRYFVEAATHPQVIAVLRTRARWMEIELVVGELEELDPASVFGAHLQSPDTLGRVRDYRAVIAALRAAGARVCVGSDLLALMIIESPGAIGADIAIGSSQRFGVPLGFGGPHAAFMAGRSELLRMIPGRIIGVSKDASGANALRMALQTREQHIRRDKATSNICTAQALLANMAAFYAVYHGPDGLRRIALRVNALARALALLAGDALRPVYNQFFDTLVFDAGTAAAEIRERAALSRINLREFQALAAPGRFAISLDETVTLADLGDLVFVLTGERLHPGVIQGTIATLSATPASIAPAQRRGDSVLTHPVFNRYRSETEFMRYLKKLENRDISLVHSMIALGSCTMKLNAAAEMAPVSWPEMASLHPFVPLSQARGYQRMFEQLGSWLAEITGFAAVSFQPNSGAQGEYTGLQSILHYLESIGQAARDVCLIPASAHGTNPASARMLGMNIVVVACDANGNIDVADLRAKVGEHAERLAALMVTYPSTHGVFESSIREICALIHGAGGQVYMDGANLNAQVGLTAPGLIGADVCHMNLHKTFAIPHGGGGPGAGPIAVAAHLAPFLPADPFGAGRALGIEQPAGNTPGNPIAAHGAPVSSAPFGSALITVVSWMYVRMLGASGVRKATELAIINANYIAARLQDAFPVLYRGENGRVAHECILDLRHLKARYGVSAEDVAKRLIDYGFHAPTLSFPVADTLMVEPTESESLAELDRFCDAMLSIHGELAAIESGEFDRVDNPLKCAPHTAAEIVAEWAHPYSREVAAYPLAYLREAKFWPYVKRVDNVAGDRNLVCTLPPVSADPSTGAAS